MKVAKTVAVAGLSSLVIVVAIILASLSLENFQTLQIISPSKRVRGKSTASTCVGYGWSTSGDPRIAVREAATKIREVMGENEPEFIILFSSSNYDEEAILSEVNRQFPLAKVYGGTSFRGVLTSDGLHTSENGYLAMMGIYSTRITFGVGYADFNEIPPEEAGEIAVRRAIEDAGVEGKVPQLIIMMVAPGKEESVMKGIVKVVGENVPIFGGSSADEDLSGQWRQFAKDKVLSNGISLVVIFSDLHIYFSYDTPYEASEYEGTITRAQGRIIYEIDGRPAAEVYNTWTNGLISEKLEKGGAIFTETFFLPLAKVARDSLGRTYRVPMCPMYVDDGAIEVYTDVENGMRIMLLRGTWELLLNQSCKSARKLVERCSDKEMIFAIFKHSAGVISILPYDERPKIPLLLAQTLTDTPFIGAFVFGEQGFLGEVGNIHGNLSNVTVVFSEERS